MREEHMRVVIVFAAVSLVVATPSAAQEFKPPDNFFAQQKKPAPKPPQVDLNSRPSADATTSPSKAMVVCGMTLVPADPKFDSRMRVAAPDSRVSYTMRTSPPPICKTP